jgi:hypothetical protein
MPSPRYWREIPTRYRLEAGRCKGCGAVSFPARRVCPECRGTAWDPTNLSWKGKVITATTVQVAPTDLEAEAPYVVAVIETPEGARLMAQIVDCDPDAIRAGTEVALEFRRVRKEEPGGILCYGFKGVPAS